MATDDLSNVGMAGFGPGKHVSSVDIHGHQ